MPLPTQFFFLVFLSLLMCLGPVHGEEADRLGLELNGLEQVDAGCRLTFVVQNEMDVELSDFALEVVLFDKKSSVMKFVVLGAGALPKSKTKVKRFNIAKSDCSHIGRVLVNDVARCKGENLSPKQCLKALVLTNKSAVSFGL